MHSIVSYGGGTNSTAMLVGMWERKERPDAITFADTGGEKPHTYRFIDELTRWCRTIDFPEIVIISGPEYWGPQMVIDGGLYEECIRLGSLPSKAYGFGKCSLKWKVEPQFRWLRKYAARCGIELSDIERLIGFDADEPFRAIRATNSALEDGTRQPWKQRFPLIEWNWGRDECVQAIARAGLSQPGKSACFFCPSSKKPEILELKRTYPTLFDMACAMERKSLRGEGQAPATTGMGLGRSFSWEDLGKAAEAQLCLFNDFGVPEIDCGCYDG